MSFHVVCPAGYGVLSLCPFLPRRARLSNPLASFPLRGFVQLRASGGPDGPLVTAPLIRLGLRTGLEAAMAAGSGRKGHVMTAEPILIDTAKPHGDGAYRDERSVCGRRSDASDHRLFRPLRPEPAKRTRLPGVLNFGSVQDGALGSAGRAEIPRRSSFAPGKRAHVDIFFAVKPF
jgi:hypothetical protein